MNRTRTSASFLAALILLASAARAQEYDYTREDAADRMSEAEQAVEYESLSRSLVAADDPSQAAHIKRLGMKLAFAQSRRNHRQDAAGTLRRLPGGGGDRRGALGRRRRAPCMVLERRSATESLRFIPPPQALRSRIGVWYADRLAAGTGPQAMERSAGTRSSGGKRSCPRTPPYAKRSTSTPCVA